MSRTGPRKPGVSSANLAKPPSRGPNRGRRKEKRGAPLERRYRPGRDLYRGDCAASAYLGICTDPVISFQGQRGRPVVSVPHCWRRLAARPDLGEADLPVMISAVLAASLFCSSAMPSGAVMIDVRKPRYGLCWSRWGGGLRRHEHIEGDGETIFHHACLRNPERFGRVDVFRVRSDVPVLLAIREISRLARTAPTDRSWSEPWESLVVIT
jgi:hypothetical protein